MAIRKVQIEFFFRRALSLSTACPNPKTEQRR